MGDERQLRRIALRQDQILELHFDRLPEPPPESIKLPGMRLWVEQLRLMRERDTQALHRLLNNLNASSSQAPSTTVAEPGPPGIQGPPGIAGPTGPIGPCNPCNP